MAKTETVLVCYNTMRHYYLTTNHLSIKYKCILNYKKDDHCIFSPSSCFCTNYFTIFLIHVSIRC